MTAWVAREHHRFEAAGKPFVYLVPSAAIFAAEAMDSGFSWVAFRAVSPMFQIASSLIVGMVAPSYWFALTPQDSHPLRCDGYALARYSKRTEEFSDFIRPSGLQITRCE